MGAIVTTEAIVSSWTGSPVAASKIVDQSVSLNMPGNTPTFIDGSGVTQVLQGLRSWTFSTNGWIGTPIVCSAPSITFSGGYTTNLLGWDLTYTVPAVETTNASQTDTGNLWQSFAPGVPSWAGNIFFRVDDAEPGVAAAHAGPTSCTLGFDGSNTLAGSIVTNSLGETVRIGEVPAVQYGFQGGGALTAAGTNNIVGAGAVAAMSPGEVVLKYGEAGSTDITRTGDAFFTSLAISCRINEVVSYNIAAQGTGPLAFSDPTGV